MPDPSFDDGGPLEPKIRPLAKLIDGRKVWDVRRLDAAFDALPDEGPAGDDARWTME